MSNDNYHRPRTGQWYKMLNAEYQERVSNLDPEDYLRRTYTSLFRDYDWFNGKRRSLRAQWKGSCYGQLFYFGDKNDLAPLAHRWERRVNKRRAIAEQLADTEEE